MFPFLGGRVRSFATITLGFLWCCACGAPKHQPEKRVVSEENTDEAVKRLPPLLRERFESDAGKKEMKRALLDKALLVEEARKRGYESKPEVQEQVRELDERLIVKELLRDETERVKPTESELEAYYKDHTSTFTEAERVHVGRAFVAARGDAAAAEKKARALKKRLAAGEPLASVAKDGDGPERVRGGDYGIVKKDLLDHALMSAAFALRDAGDISDVVATDGGFSVLVLKEHLAPRLIPFAEARPDVIAHLKPELERRAFDSLIKELRAHDKAEADR